MGLLGQPGKHLPPIFHLGWVLGNYSKSEIKKKLRGFLAKGEGKMIEKLFKTITHDRKVVKKLGIVFLSE